jgi:hypothetical protein
MTSQRKILSKLPCGRGNLSALIGIDNSTKRTGNENFHAGLQWEQYSPVGEVESSEMVTLMQR